MKKINVIGIMADTFEIANRIYDKKAASKTICAQSGGVRAKGD